MYDVVTSRVHNFVILNNEQTVSNTWVQSEEMSIPNYSDNTYFGVIETPLLMENAIIFLNKLHIP